MTKCSRLALGVAAAAIGCSLATEPVAAQVASANGEVDSIGLRLGASRSDNIRQVSQMPESGSYALLGLIADWSRNGTRLSSEMSSDLEYRDYSVSGLDNELYGFASVLVDIALVPERFDWSFAEYIANGRPDAFAHATPNNRNAVNVFSTGPGLDLPIGDRTTLGFDATSERRDVKDDASLDSDVLDFGFSVARRIRANTDVGLHLSDRDIEYNNSLQQREIRAAYLRYTRTLAGGSASIAVGQSEFDDGISSDTTPYFSLDWASEIGTRSSWSLALNQRYVDAFEESNFVADADLILSSDVYEDRSLGFRFDVHAGRNEVSLQTSFGESEYTNDSSLDNDELVFEVGWNRAISERMGLGLNLRRWKRDFVHQGRKEDDVRRTLYLRRDFSGPMALELRFERQALSGLEDGDVKDDTISIYLDYALLGG